ncbi:hypothetical protein, partial [uncultured Halomonas sp.]|uniref:hypothetical protein n=1 Tax=uncultured Halomonas sp. TaxID=173971 RepID=UPI00261DB0B2
MPLTPDAVAVPLRAALPDAWDSPSWRAGHISPAWLRVEGHEHLRRLRIGVEFFLVAREDAPPCRLRGELVSQSWSPLAPLPPFRQRLAAETPDLPGDASLSLSYTLTGLGKPVSVGGDQSWMKY